MTDDPPVIFPEHHSPVPVAQSPVYRVQAANSRFPLLPALPSLIEHSPQYFPVHDIGRRAYAIWVRYPALNRPQGSLSC